MMTTISLLGPFIGLFLSINSGGELHIRHFVSLFVGGLVGFFLLRFTLWNIFGREHFEIKHGKIHQIADYKWFKSSLKSLDVEALHFEIVPVGYEEDGNGVLCLIGAEEQIVSSVKMPITELEILIKKLHPNTE